MAIDALAKSSDALHQPEGKRGGTGLPMAPRRARLGDRLRRNPPFFVEERRIELILIRLTVVHTLLNTCLAVANPGCNGQCACARSLRKRPKSAEPGEWPF
jgi:hypothetical protein